MTDKMGRRQLFGMLAGAVAAVAGIGVDSSAQATALKSTENCFIRHQARANRTLARAGRDIPYFCKIDRGTALVSFDGITWSEVRA